jgi:hypothetical protein
MRSIPRLLILVGAIVLVDSRSAVAGMPSLTLTDLARMRIETISFFLLCFLVSSELVRRIWNAARRDFPRLPYLSFGRAISLVAIWGLLFVLVLTMISGARELMTPGAWRKEGLTYKLVDDGTDVKPAAIPLELRRREALDRLRVALWTYARSHGGKFPANDNATEIPQDVWHVPDPSGMRFVFRGGLSADQGDEPLAFEPAIFGDDRFVLTTAGTIVRMSEAALRNALAAKGAR